MSPKKASPKPAESTGFDVEAARAQSVAQSLKMIDTLDAANARSVGTWFRLPRGTEAWHYVRCGIQNTDAALQMAYRLRQCGYVRAHPDVRLAGFEQDGDRMLIMCCPPETFERVQQAKRKASARASKTVADSLDADIRSLGRHGDVSITGGEGVGSVADFSEAVRKM